MKSVSLAALLSLLLIMARAQNKQQDLPHVINNAGYPELMVNGRPFLMMGGELGNSSASNMAYMMPVWPKVKKMHLNTLVAPVYWELLEPNEGKFNFTLIDDLVAGARKNHMKLVLLWFGTWKNSMSVYVPAWIKTNVSRFPRAKTFAGESQEIITPFAKNALDADKKAFAALMRHMRDMDGKQHTVLMIQVENEIGMLPEARDHSKVADEAFAGPVPSKLFAYLAAHRNSLRPEIKKHWQENGFKTAGTWEEVFGKSLATDELFMAWYFGVYANEVAKAGKEIYHLPMYVNAALNHPGKKPGEYPSAGPLPHLFDVWKAAAPDIDLLSPDFYNPDFKYWNDLYTRPDNALFIPEHRFEDGVDAKAFYVIGHYHALGFSPFSIESTKKPGSEPIGEAYAIIDQLAGEISKAKKRKSLEGVLLSKDTSTVQIEMGGYILTVSHEFTLGWSAGAKDKNWPLAGGIIIGLSDDEFYVGGTGLVITFKPKTNGLRAGILNIDEGQFINGKWQPGRRMNGDQDHQGRHLRIPQGEYGIQRVRLYTYP
ncbi:MAG: mannonate dehydratase [Mucilaginibacter sp.]|nr:mannonate dehydratase [Mucilaginibacter sp.]